MQELYAHEEELALAVGEKYSYAGEIDLSPENTQFWGVEIHTPFQSADAMDNRQLFEELRKLGADRAFEEQVMKVQLRKNFVYPSVAGCSVTDVFSLIADLLKDCRNIEKLMDLFELKL